METRTPADILPGLVEACIKSITANKGKRRAYIGLDLVGDRGGGWVEVYPGVKGQAKGFTKNKTTGAIFSTRVQVCARTLIAAFERDGLIKLESVPA